MQGMRSFCRVVRSTMFTFAARALLGLTSGKSVAKTWIEMNARAMRSSTAMVPNDERWIHLVVSVAVDLVKYIYRVV